MLLSESKNMARGISTALAWTLVLTVYITDYAFDKSLLPLFGYRHDQYALLTVDTPFLWNNQSTLEIIYLFYNTLILLSESKNMARGISKRTLATLVIKVPIMPA